MDPPPPPAAPRRPVADIDPTFVPRRAFGTELHQVGDQLLVTKGSRGVPYELNPTGALAWRCFDGSVSLEVLAGELADAARAPVAEVEADLVELARALGGSGLLAGIDPGVPTSQELDLVIDGAVAWLRGTAGAELGQAATDWTTPGPRDPPLDWALVGTLARGHRLSHAVQRALIAPGGPADHRRSPGSTGQPAAGPASELADALAEQLAANAAHARVLVTHLGMAVDALTAAHVRVLAFKGPVLARAQLLEPEDRECRDLDLLVARRDHRRAQAVLAASGYRPLPPGRGATATPGRPHEVDLTDATGSVVIDLHRGLAPRSFRTAVPFGELWSRRGWVELAGAGVAAPSVEDMILLACIQVAKDAWERRLVLSKLVDLAALVERHPEADLDALWRRARGLGQMGIVQFSLTLTDQVLGPLPGLPYATRPDRRETWGRVVEARRDLAVGGSPRGGQRRARFHADLRERRRDRIGPQLRWMVVPTEDDFQRFPLPRQLRAVHYGLRPLRLARAARRDRP
jgi:hypothetical protein